MINKGVIIEISKKYLIILCEDGEYLKLKSKKGVYVSQEIYYTQNDLYKKKISYTKLSSIAAVFIMCFAITSFFYLNNPMQPYGEEWAVVSVDINPSIEISLNGEYIVRSVIPLNNDAKQLISDEWIGKDFDLVMTSYIDAAVENKYLNEEGTVLIAYYSKGQSIEEEAIEEKFEKIMNNSKAENPNIAYVNSNKEDLKNARKEKISLGRYGVYKELSEESGQTIEKVRKGKVKDLIEKSNNVKMVKFKYRKNQNENNKDNNKIQNDNQNENQNKHQNNKPNGNNGKPNDINPGNGNGPNKNIDRPNKNKPQVQRNSEEQVEVDLDEEPISEDKLPGNKNDNNQKPINKDEATQNKNKPQSHKNSDKEGNTNSKGNNHSKNDKRVGS